MEERKSSLESSSAKALTEALIHVTKEDLEEIPIPLPMLNQDILLPGQDQLKLSNKQTFHKAEKKSMYPVCLVTCPSEQVKDILTPATYSEENQGYQYSKERKAVWAVKFFPWGRKGDHIFAVLWDNQTTEELCGLTWSYIPLPESQNHPLLITGGKSSLIQVLNCSTMSLSRTLIGCFHSVSDLKTHPTQHRFILSASKDYSLRLWDVLNGAQLAIFLGEGGHLGEVLTVNWSWDGEFFASGGVDCSVKLWKITPHIKELMRKSSYYYPQPNILQNIHFSAPYLTTYRVHFPIFSTHKIHHNYIDSLSFFGNFLLSKDGGGEILLYKPHTLPHDPNNTQIIRKYKYILTEEVFLIRFTCNQKLGLLAVGNNLGHVYVFDLNSYWTGVDEEAYIQDIDLGLGHCIVRDIAYSNDDK